MKINRKNRNAGITKEVVSAVNRNCHMQNAYTYVYRNVYITTTIAIMQASKKRNYNKQHRIVSVLPVHQRQQQCKRIAIPTNINATTTINNRRQPQTTIDAAQICKAKKKQKKNTKNDVV